VTLTTRVNGEVRQHDSTARLMFPFDYLIAYLSTFATLKPGDVIVTGTPTGAVPASIRHAGLSQATWSRLRCPASARCATRWWTRRRSRREHTRACH
jgi:2-keto-4-pentenoate hydratase/2-oxohepta-3-ene-1,7-dioic acid hydratase in catechol pathway